MFGSRSLVLITVDCFRADHAGFMGYQRPTTPFLDCLAGEGYVFRNAIAAGAPTYYSVPSILASRYPLGFGRDVLGVAPDETTIASVLRDSGFATAAFSAANPYISERFGYDRGFEVFRSFIGKSEFTPDAGPVAMRLRPRINRALSRACHFLPGLGNAYDELYFRYCQRVSDENASLDALRRFPSADILVDQATAWIKENCGRPFLLWLHLMDPHAPYFPKADALALMGQKGITANQARYANARWNRQDLTSKRLAKNRHEVIALYDAGIRWADEQIRRLSESLVEMNLWNRCALAVTADHGEEFLEHGARYHPPLSLHQELIHVPLLIRVPGHVGGSVDSPTGLVDLAPTLLDVVGIPSPAEFRGRSCWKSLRSSESWDRVVITECVRGCTNPFYRENRLGNRILAVRRGPHKLVLNFSDGRDVLFDLAADPSERHPLPADALKGVREELLQHGRRHLSESHKSRDFDTRQAMQVRDLRLEWAHSAAHGLN